MAAGINLLESLNLGFKALKLKFISRRDSRSGLLIIIVSRLTTSLKKAKLGIRAVSAEALVVRQLSFFLLCLTSGASAILKLLDENELFLLT